MKKIIWIISILLVACGSAIVAQDLSDTEYEWEGLWNWVEVKATDEGVTLYGGHDVEICAGDVEIYHDGTCQMSERCIRQSGVFTSPVYIVDCEWRLSAPNLMYLRMYASDRAWYQEFIAISSQDREKATIARVTAGEVSYLNAYKSDVRIADALGDIPLCGQEYCYTSDR